MLGLVLLAALALAGAYFVCTTPKARSRLCALLSSGWRACSRRCGRSDAGAALLVEPTGEPENQTSRAETELGARPVPAALERARSQRGSMRLPQAARGADHGTVV